MGKKADRRAAMAERYAARKKEERELGLLAQEKDRLAREERQAQIAKEVKARNARTAAILATAQIAAAALEKKETNA